MGDGTFQFVFDHNSARQTNTWVSSSLTDNERSVRFNIGDLTGADLGALSEAHATLTIDGQDVSRYDLHPGVRSGEHGL